MKSAAIKMCIQGGPMKSSSCICMRPYVRVICRQCGCTFRGRIRVQCPSHLNIMFLNDISQCPDCKAKVEHLLEYMY